MNQSIKHLPHYLSLIGIFIFGLIGFYEFQYDRYFLIALSVALAFSYVSWGVIHHAIHEDLTLSVFFEYLTMAMLGVVTVLSLIYRT